MILSIMLYNAETWTLTKQEQKFLAGSYAHMARYAMGEKRKQTVDGIWETTQSFLTRHRLEKIDRIIARKKASWIGHFWRGNDTKFKEEMERLYLNKHEWWVQCEREFGKFGTTVKKVLDAAKLDRSKSAITIQKMFNIPGRTIGPQQINT